MDFKTLISDSKKLEELNKIKNWDFVYDFIIKNSNDGIFYKNLEYEMVKKYNNLVHEYSETVIEMSHIVNKLNLRILQLSNEDKITIDEEKLETEKRKIICGIYSFVYNYGRLPTYKEIKESVKIKFDYKDIVKKTIDYAIIKVLGEKNINLLVNDMVSNRNFNLLSYIKTTDLDFLLKFNCNIVDIIKKKIEEESKVNSKIIEPSFESPENNTILEPSFESPENNKIIEPSSFESPENNKSLEPSSFESPENNKSLEPSSFESPENNKPLEPSSSLINPPPEPIKKDFIEETKTECSLDKL